MDSLIVGVLGDFTQWRPATYVVGDQEKGVSARMSTVALYDYLRGEGRDPRVLIVAPETLAALNRWVRRGNGYVEAREVLAIPDPIEYFDPHVGSRTPLCKGEYRGFIERLEKTLVEVVEEISGGSLRPPTLRVSVMPAVGSYTYAYSYDPASKSVKSRSASWRLAEVGGLNPFTLFASEALLAILNSLLDLDPKERLEMHVDVTHGVNYMQTALYRAALTAARIYSLSRRVTIELYIYNSDPYPRGFPGQAVLRLWRIRSEKVTPRLAASRAFYMVARGWGRRLFWVHGEVMRDKEEWSGCKEAVKKFNDEIGRTNAEVLGDASLEAAVASFYGFPLLLLQAGGAARSGQLDRMLGLLGGRPEVVAASKPSPDSIVFERLGGFGYDALKRVLALAAFGDYARSVYLDASRLGGALVWRPCERRVVASLEALWEAARYTPTPNTYLTHQELSKLESALKLDCGTEDLYTRICKAVTEHTPQPAPGRAHIDVRVFVAHAGLPSNIVDVEYHPDHGALLAYSRDALDKLANVARNLVERLREEL